MNLEEVMSINVDNLKHRQFTALKQHTMKKLYEVADLINNNQFEKARMLLAFSPAGDGMGCDNHFINFSYREGEAMDIMDMLDRLDDLKN